jgi:bifunctional UDP-N-acetylglucosamine pyrophosphorylase/glucosamine-1-phosphate N-acetyltransferase
MNNTSALILAAGEGKRMKSKYSKLTHKLCGKAMIEWVFCAVKEADINDVVLVLGKNAEQVKSQMKKYTDDKIAFAIQDTPLGTGHAVMQAEEHYKGYNGNIVVLCGDTPLIKAETIESAINYHISAGYSATVITAEFDDPTGYGRVLRNSEGDLEGIVEHRDATDEQKAVKEINSGMYIFSSQDLFDAVKKLDNNNDQGEYYLTDTIGIMKNKGLKLGAFKMEDPREVLGVNDRLQLAQASEILRADILEKLMKSGVTIVDPKTTYVGHDVKIGMDTIIYPGCTIDGEVTIGEDCEIGPNTTIINSQIANGVKILNSVVFEGSLESYKEIGPFEYIKEEKL